MSPQSNVKVAVLVHVPIDKVRFIPDGLAGLLKFLQSADLKELSKLAAILIYRAEYISYYVRSGEEVVRCAKVARAWGLETLTVEDVAEIFDVHEYTPSEKVALGKIVSDSAVIIENEKPIGVWIKCDEDWAYERDIYPRHLAPSEGTRDSVKMAKPPSDQDQAGVGAVGDDIIHRTPHMNIFPDIPLALGQKFSVEVYTDRTGARPGEEVEELAIAAPLSIKEFPVDIWLMASEHFVIKSQQFSRMVIARNRDKSDSVIFNIGVRKEIEAFENAYLTAFFSYQGRAGGKVRRAVSLENPNSKSKKVAGDQPQADKHQGPPAYFQFNLTDEQPDLTIEILSTNDERKYVCRIFTPLINDPHISDPEDWVLGSKTSEIVTKYLDKFTAKQATNAARYASLKGAGIQLYDASPARFKKVFWDLIDRGATIRTILVISEEPFIPWELMIPHRNQTKPEERTPLGVEFSIGRWVTEKHLSPPQKLTFDDSLVVCPKYMDQRELKNSEDEATFICNRLKGTRVAPANFEEFEKAMEKGGATILHFVCHGGSPDIVSQEIDLEGTDKLDSVQLEGMDGVKDACRSKKPFVFLNACETGRPIPALIGTGGFARAFIQVGASAMVAPLWSVRDSIAHDIALEFYQKLIDDSAKSLAEVIRSIRQKAYTTNQGEDTFAAYCFYGDPLARFHKLG